MQLVVGGAYSGKRTIVRNQYNYVTWHSAYEGALLTDWSTNRNSSQVLVLEGWEKWIQEKLASTSNIDEVRVYFIEQIDELCRFEKMNGQMIMFVMLEMGRGIVPLEEKDRNVRDVAGWILQYAAKRAETVDYCWHGLSKKIK